MLVDGKKLPKACIYLDFLLLKDKILNLDSFRAAILDSETVDIFWNSVDIWNSVHIFHIEKDL